MAARGDCDVSFKIETRPSMFVKSLEISPDWDVQAWAEFIRG